MTVQFGSNILPLWKRPPDIGPLGKSTFDLVQNCNPITGDNIVNKHPLFQFKGMNFDGFDFEKRSKPSQFAMMGALRRILGEAAETHKDGIEPLVD